LGLACPGWRHWASTRDGFWRVVAETDPLHPVTVSALRVRPATAVTINLVIASLVCIASIFPHL
jgi:hypothetical protein